MEEETLCCWCDYVFGPKCWNPFLERFPIDGSIELLNILWEEQLSDSDWIITVILSRWGTPNDKNGNAKAQETDSRLVWRWNDVDIHYSALTEKIIETKMFRPFRANRGRELLSYMDWVVVWLEREDTEPIREA